MAKITYLLGAGASANTIPIVSDMHARIAEIVKKLETYKNPNFFRHHDSARFATFPENLKIENNPTLITIIDNLNWLLNEAEKYFSIDTLARKYYLTDDEENYERLKECLIFYFTLEQFIFFQSIPNDKDYLFNKKPIDKRYDSFISAIAAKSNGGIILNDDIKILTWNYDLQFELSLKRFRETATIQDIKQQFHISPPLYYPSQDFKLQINKEKFCLLKLNGNAIYSCTQSSAYNYPTIFDIKFNEKKSEAELLGKLIDEWGRLDFKRNSACRYFNFAWEGNQDFTGRKHDHHSNIIKEAELIAGETEILIVIGYSFPIFNREIDNELFKKMGKLKKIYIQDKYPEKIKSTMKNAFEIFQQMKIAMADRPQVEMDMIEFYLDDNTDQFIIPYELKY